MAPVPVAGPPRGLRRSAHAWMRSTGSFRRVANGTAKNAGCGCRARAPALAGLGAAPRVRPLDGRVPALPESACGSVAQVVRAHA